MISNIRTSPQPICVRTNGGHQISTLIGDITNLGIVWYNPQSIANILSVSEVRKVCCVTMDTQTEPSICIHKTNGKQMVFREHSDGLYYYDTVAHQGAPESTPPTILYQSVEENKKIVTKREIEAADVARDLYRKIGRPSEAKFEDIIAKNLIRNCPVTLDDVRRAMLIYGPDTAILKGKTILGKPAGHLPNFNALPIPLPINQNHSKVTLCVDFFCTRSNIPTYHLSNFTAPYS
jgi:hypothetical protein